ncbi:MULTISPECIES: precorrin-6y C5,15-methyltransferase (decarboxylating) subunit CbiE [Halomonadaceae]|uniref:precorrin-6y C5,15-methyltransferase (decarboxylating) subunit CbiE n=1 Tax=Halomonadaceae TaxID=28256 RepID=UPI0012F02A95|nr:MULTISPECIES: precorrin-6y C5,15-methyltransferase (decarboxylating) subunit CbiE [Halomonas]CAD5254162.1 Precorrin-6Y C(5,15)-methyltransferase (decarboxylating) [Halomonas sp. I3]CAD5254694.1 Precorrin-6Y C(5,15)-methyltransferase (decarboxylating) [Halomonas sp. 156]CAD5294457.1 Precorrin-6Y C(5,15)-methyltransferase (decarboxylating) [Halomonas sp. 113]CAD5295680.1 Precorrin-6Y C(5,15)-methyltransferase (decarboxylating) [Halomonas sp. 59]VXB84129.1 Precorrin-6Y C(5,15)-methyltransferas
MVEISHAPVCQAPWLTLLGWGEGGTQGLTAASRAALESAEVVFGARRHLRLLPPLNAEVIEWPVPFADGISELLNQRGRRVVMLVSNDPFWFGAGTSLAQHLSADEWLALPAPSTFSLVAARLGWPLERCTCLGLHAKPLTRIRPYLHAERRLLVLVRDGEAVAEFASLVSRFGFGDSQLTVLEALGGDNERIRHCRVDASLPQDIAHPVALALEVAGSGPALPLTPGLPDHFFDHDGQITKQTIRAITLAALAPMPGERLWDIGTGSGSIAIEWLLAHPDNQAVGFEQHAERAARARSNAANLGVDWLEVKEGSAPEVLNDTPHPDAVFIGGGLSQALLDDLWQRLPEGVRIVANAVTLESEALLAHWHQQAGGELLRLELANAAPIGTRRGWKASYPIVQWRGVR